MTTFKVGDKVRKVNSRTGDWLRDGEIVTITSVHSDECVSVANGRANVVIDVNQLEPVPTPAPTADTQPAAGEVRVVVEKVLGLWRYEILVGGKLVASNDGYHTEALARDVANHEAKKYHKDDPLIVAYGDGYAAGYSDGRGSYDTLQAEKDAVLSMAKRGAVEVANAADTLATLRADNARLADELARAQERNSHLEVVYQTTISMDAQTEMLETLLDENVEVWADLSFALDQLRDAGKSELLP